MQDFDYGGQDGSHEDSSYRARAVRRLSIPQFNHLAGV
jgi:hypothetical protein